jgi:hypothetical protein
MAAALAWGLAFATILTLFVIPSLFSIVDDIRARAGKLDVEGERQPDLKCSFSEGLVQQENGLALSGGAAIQPPSGTNEPAGGEPHGGDL